MVTRALRRTILVSQLFTSVSPLWASGSTSRLSDPFQESPSPSSSSLQSSRQGTVAEAIRTYNALKEAFAKTLEDSSEIFDLEQIVVQRPLPNQTVEAVSLKTFLADEARQSATTAESEIRSRTQVLQDVIKDVSKTLREAKKADQKKCHESQVEFFQSDALQKAPLQRYVGGLQTNVFMSHSFLKTLEEQAIAGRQDPVVLFLLKEGLLHHAVSPRLAARYYGQHLRVRREDQLSLQICEAFEPFLKNNPEFPYEVALNLLLPHQEQISEVVGSSVPPSVTWHEIVFTGSALTRESRVLNPDISEQVFNANGTFKEYRNYNKKRVARAQIGPHVLYFAHLPELPGMEEAVGTLRQYILNDVPSYMRLFRMENNGIAIPVLVSQGIEGVSLQEATEEMLTHLDPERFSALTLMTMLTMPEDGGRDSYVVRELRTGTGEHRYEIIPISNGRSFVLPAAKEERIAANTWKALQVKTALYCLDAMKQTVAPQVRERFMRQNFEEVLTNWLQELVLKGREYESLFPHSQARETLYTNHQSFVGIPLPPDVAARIYYKTRTVQRLLSENPRITHLELLSKIEPVLGERYGWILNQQASLQTRFDYLDGTYFGRDGTKQVTLSTTADILANTTVNNTRETRNLIAIGRAYSPEIALMELQRTIRDDTSNRLNLQQINTVCGLEEVLKSSTRKELNLQEQQQFLELLIQRFAAEPSLKQITHLDLRKLFALQARHLKKFPELPNLVYADLSETGIETDGIIAFRRIGSQVKHLVVEDCSRLEKIVGEERTFDRDPPLHLPYLQSFIGDRNASLMRVRLNAPELKSLRLSHTPAFRESLELTAPFLKHLTFENNAGGVTGYLDVLNRQQTELLSRIQTGHPESLAQLRLLASQGEVTAQFNLGMIYKDARGVDHNEQEAAKWLQRASDKSHTAARDQLDLMRCQKAAIQGDIGAQYKLGFIHMEGRGTPQNDREAAVWFRKAAEGKNPQAQNNLGVMYATARGVEKNMREAAKWYRLAAEAGLSASQNNLGWMYANGWGLPQDDRQAVFWYRKAAETRHAVAQFNLGVMYENGRGVEKNDQEAFRWYKLAAEQALSLAQFKIGFMYDFGQGVEKNEHEGSQWRRLATTQAYIGTQCHLWLTYQ